MPDADGDERDQPGDSPHLRSSGLSSSSTRSESAAIRPSSVCMPGGEDERPRLAADAARAAEDQLARLEHRAGRVDELGRPKDRLRLAGERGQIDLDGPGEQAGIGTDPVPLLDHEDIAGHEAAGLDLLRAPVAAARGPEEAGNRRAPRPRARPAAPARTRRRR